MQSVEFDYKQLLKALNGRARAALESLLEDPDNPDTNQEFRKALRPAMPHDSLPQQETSAITKGSPVYVDCTVIGRGNSRNHSTTDVHELGSLKIDLADLLADNEGLVRVLAHHLADPASTSLQSAFLDGVKTAIDFEDLPSDIGNQVTVGANHDRLDIDGRAVSKVGDRGKVTVTRTLSIGGVTGRRSKAFDDIRRSSRDSRTSPMPSCDRETRPAPSSDMDKSRPPSSVKEEREIDRRNNDGPSIGGPGGIL